MSENIEDIVQEKRDSTQIYELGLSIKEVDRIIYTLQNTSIDSMLNFYDNIKYVIDKYNYKHEDWKYIQTTLFQGILDLSYTKSHNAFYNKNKHQIDAIAQEISEDQTNDIPQKRINEFYQDSYNKVNHQHNFNNNSLKKLIGDSQKMKHLGIHHTYTIKLEVLSAKLNFLLWENKKVLAERTYKVILDLLENLVKEEKKAGMPAVLLAIKTMLAFKIKYGLSEENEVLILDLLNKKAFRNLDSIELERVRRKGGRGEQHQLVIHLLDLFHSKKDANIPFNKKATQDLCVKIGELYNTKNKIIELNDFDEVIDYIKEIIETYGFKKGDYYVDYLYCSLRHRYEYRKKDYQITKEGNYRKPLKQYGSKDPSSIILTKEQAKEESLTDLALVLYKMNRKSIDTDKNSLIKSHLGQKYLLLSYFSNHLGLRPGKELKKQRLSARHVSAIKKSIQWEIQKTMETDGYVPQGFLSALSSNFELQINKVKASISEKIVILEEKSFVLVEKYSNGTDSNISLTEQIDNLKNDIKFIKEAYADTLGVREVRIGGIINDTIVNSGFDENYDKTLSEIAIFGEKNLEKNVWHDTSSLNSQKYINYQRTKTIDLYNERDKKTNKISSNKISTNMQFIIIDSTKLLHNPNIQGTDIIYKDTGIYEKSILETGINEGLNLDGNILKLELRKEQLQKEIDRIKVFENTPINDLFDSIDTEKDIELVDQNSLFTLFKKRYMSAIPAGFMLIKRRLDALENKIPLSDTIEKFIENVNSPYLDSQQIELLKDCCRLYDTFKEFPKMEKKDELCDKIYSYIYTNRKYNHTKILDTFKEILSLNNQLYKLQGLYNDPPQRKRNIISEAFNAHLIFSRTLSLNFTEKQLELLGKELAEIGIMHPTMAIGFKKIAKIKDKNDGENYSTGSNTLNSTTKNKFESIDHFVDKAVEILKTKDSVEVKKIKNAIKRYKAGPTVLNSIADKLFISTGKNRITSLTGTTKQKSYGRHIKMNSDSIREQQLLSYHDLIKEIESHITIEDKKHIIDSEGLTANIIEGVISGFLDKIKESKDSTTSNAYQELNQKFQNLQATSATQEDDKSVVPGELEKYKNSILSMKGIFEKSEGGTAVRNVITGNAHEEIWGIPHQTDTKYNNPDKGEERYDFMKGDLRDPDPISLYHIMRYDGERDETKKATNYVKFMLYPGSTYDISINSHTSPTLIRILLYTGKKHTKPIDCGKRVTIRYIGSDYRSDRVIPFENQNQIFDIWLDTIAESGCFDMSRISIPERRSIQSIEQIVYSIRDWMYYDNPNGENRNICKEKMLEKIVKIFGKDSIEAINSKNILNDSGKIETIKNKKSLQKTIFYSIYNWVNLENGEDREKLKNHIINSVTKEFGESSIENLNIKNALDNIELKE